MSAFEPFVADCARGAGTAVFDPLIGPADFGRLLEQAGPARGDKIATAGIGLVGEFFSLSLRSRFASRCARNSTS